MLIGMWIVTIALMWGAYCMTRDHVPGPGDGVAK